MKKTDKRFNKATIIWILLAIISFILFNFFFKVKILRKSHEIAIVTILIDIILASSLNLILGIAGQFSLGHAGFMAIGAYSTAIILDKMPNTGGFALALLIGAIVSIMVALIVAIPTLRLKGDYLAIATLGVSEIIRIIITNLGDITGGAIGIRNIERIPKFSSIYIITLITLLILSTLKNSRYGRAWGSILEDEIASNAMGVNIFLKKVSAFIIGAIFASIAGGIYASYFTIIQPNIFDFSKSVDILTIVVLGGLGSFSGTVISAIIIGLINIIFQSFAQERVIIYSILLIVMMIFKPEGLLGKYEFSFRKLLFKEEKHEPINN